MKIGSKIKELRLAKNLTLKQLSEKTGMCVASISNIEAGLQKPGVVSLKKFSEALEIDYDELYQLVY